MQDETGDEFTEGKTTRTTEWLQASEQKHAGFVSETIDEAVCPLLELGFTYLNREQRERPMIKNTSQRKSGHATNTVGQ